MGKLLIVFCFCPHLSLCLFSRHLQIQDPSIERLEGQYQAVISSLRSKLGSRTAPPLLHVNPVYLQEGLPIKLPFFPSSTRAPDHSSSSSSLPKPLEHWSLLIALVEEYQKSRTHDDAVTENAPQSNFLLKTDASPDTEWSATTEDFTFVENEDGTDIKSTASSIPEVIQHDGPHREGLDSEHGRLHRKSRSLQRRQTSAAKGKSMHHTMLGVERVHTF